MRPIKTIVQFCERLWFDNCQSLNIPNLEAVIVECWFPVVSLNLDYRGNIDLETRILLTSTNNENTFKIIWHVIGLFDKR